MYDADLIYHSVRHTWHADQETTVLLHFCHHLPTDFFHIPIWTGGLDFFSISSPLTDSQQKAPLVRFLLKQLITRSGVFWLGRQQAASPPPLHASVRDVFMLSTRHFLLCEVVSHRVTALPVAMSILGPRKQPQSQAQLPPPTQKRLWFSRLSLPRFRPDERWLRFPS